MKKGLILILCLVLLAPILNTASGNNSSGALQAYTAGKKDDMIVYVKNYLSTAQGKDQVDRYYIPWLKQEASGKDLRIRFEWVFFPTYFSDEKPKEFMETLEEMLTDEVCTVNKKTGKKTCKLELVELDVYAERLITSSKTPKLHNLSKEELLELLNTDLNVEGTSEKDLWGEYGDKVEGDGVPENYLQLRQQYKMGYPFKEKFILYAPFGYSEIYGDIKHLGADLNKSPNNCCGIPIYSVSNGLVTWVGQDKAGANIVFVQTGDVSIMYAHMSQPSHLIAGSAINKGDLIGYVGSTGYSTGCHLHLEMRYKGAWINPEIFIDLKNGKSYY